MKNTSTTEDQRRWVEQWRQTAIALDEVKCEELAKMTDEAAWQSMERLLELASFYCRKTTTSGFVEQQAWFHRRPRR